MKNEVNQMKELYIAPEAEIIRFAPFEKLAANDDWVNGISLEQGSGPEIDIPENPNPSEDGEM